MLILEPQTAYERRQRSGAYAGGPDGQHPSSNLALPVIGRPARDDFWTELVFQQLGVNAGEPVPITTLVNSVARQGNFSKRADYDRKRVELFRVVGRLIRTGRLDRVGRKYVTIAPPDSQQQPCDKAVTQPLDLPSPRV